MGETSTVRKGEEIDAMRLSAFLSSELGTDGGEIDVEQFPAGSSNLTYLIRFGAEEYVLRRPPFGNTVATAHDMRREFDVLSKLSKVYPPAPRPLIFSDDVSLIGSEFYLMERRRGLIVRGSFPVSIENPKTKMGEGSASQAELPSQASGGVPDASASHAELPSQASGRVSDASASQAGLPSQTSGRVSDASASQAERPSQASGRVPDASASQAELPSHASRPTSDLDTSQPFRRQVCEGFISALAELHSIDPAAAGLADLGKPEGYVRRQVEGWSRRYASAKTSSVSDIERSISWLVENLPSHSAASLIHNDYKFDNVMLDPADITRVSTVLDWEMVTVGDPLMDLGTTLGYWMSRNEGDAMLAMPFNPRVLMENISREDLVEMYSAAAGRDVSDILFYYVFGTFKIAVICQQIYARFVKGLTADPRFSSFDRVVSQLGSIAASAIARRSI